MMARTHSVRRWFRVVLSVLGASLATALLAVLLILLIAPVRENLLADMILPRIAHSLPGRLVVGDIRWPRLGELELREIIWTGSPDTLATADRCAISFDLAALLRRDLRITMLTIEQGRADIRAIRDSFPSGDSPEPTATEAKTRLGLRDGSVAGLPSIEVDEIILAIVLLRLPDGSTLRDLNFAGEIDLLRGSGPLVRVDSLSASAPEQGWSVRRARLALDPALARLKGFVQGDIAGVPIFLDLSSPADGALHLVATTVEGSPPPASPGVMGTVNLERRPDRPARISFDLRLRTPGTAEIRSLFPALDQASGLPDLDGVGGRLEGFADLLPDLSARMRLDLDPSEWLTGGRGRFTLQDGAISIDTLQVALFDLAVGAEASFSAGNVRGEAELSARGSRWLSLLQPETDLPEQLRFDLRALFEGPIDSLAVTADLEAAATFQSFVLDTLRARIESTGGPRAMLSGEAQALGFLASLEAEIDWSSVLTARVAPIHIAEVTGEPMSRYGRSSGNGGTGVLRFDRGIAVSDLRIRGALGDAVIDGTYDPMIGGSMAMEASWPSPPAFLLRRITGRKPLADSLEYRWRDDGPFRIRLSAEIGPGQENQDLRGHASLRLPGPKTFEPLAPENVEVDDLGAIDGQVTWNAEMGREGATFACDVDLEATDWIDDGRIVILGDHEDLLLDSLRFSIEGLNLESRGTIRRDTLDLTAVLRIPDAALLERFLGNRASPVEAMAEIRADLRGTLKEPEVEVSFTGSGLFGPHRIPSLAGQLSYRARRVAADIEAPEGLDLDRIRVDGLTAAFASVDSSFLPARLRLDVRGKEIGLTASSSLSADSTIGIDIDTLHIRVTDRDLRNTRPFRIDIGRTSRSIRASGIRLAGTLGTLQAAGYAGAEGLDLQAALDLEVPGKPSFIKVSERLWPDRAAFDIRTGGADSLRADLRLTGFSFADREAIEVRASCYTIDSQIEGTLDVADRSGPLIQGKMRIPAMIQMRPLRAEILPGVLDGGIELLGCPVPIREGTLDLDSGDHPARLDGQISIAGTTEKPTAQAVLRLSFPKWRRLSSYGLSLDAASRADSVRAAFIVERQDRRLLDGSVEFPASVSLLSGTAAIPDGARLDLRVESENFALADFSELLPGFLTVGGTAQLRLLASGPVAELDLDGKLKADALEISMADGTRARADIDVEVAGTSKRPSLGGRMEIVSGALRIPETQRSLHPTSGSAVLWELEQFEPRMIEADPDSLTQAEDGRSAEDEPPLLPPLDLDIDVEIPSGLWIRGRGLEVELAGGLQVTQTGAMLPTITGTLTAVRGQLVFVGRVFSIERGHVVFYGGDEINPSLDLVLSTRMEEMVIRILVKGTAKKPELALSSEPEMTEGDIMAYLLFGRPIGDLDSSQVAHLENRATDVASSYAIAQLQGRISNQLGVDMLTIQQGKGSGRRSALIVGKYLSRRALLKYEQALESTTDFFINLEYFLSRSLKVETLIGSQSQSAIEINWSRRF